MIEVVGPPIDPARLQKVLSGVFEARSVKIRSAVPLEAAPMTQRPNLRKLGGRILDKLADGKPWRAKHLIREVAGARKPATVKHEIDLLLKEGRIQRPRLGVYMLAGLPHPKPDEIPPLHENVGKAAWKVSTPGGRNGQRILDLLDRPISATQTHKELGMSRQGVDRLLRLLAKSELVHRIPDPGRKGRWLWMLSHSRVTESLDRYVPSLSDDLGRILNALVPEAFHDVSEVAAVTGLSKVTVKRDAESLQARGLVSGIRIGAQHYVGITVRGMDHPGRKHEGTPAAVVDLVNALGPRRVAIIETLGVLGEARPLELTAALAGIEDEGDAPIPSATVARLLEGDFTEPVPRESSGQRRYRLTDVGRMVSVILGRERRPPSRERLEQRIQSYRAARTPPALREEPGAPRRR